MQPILGLDASLRADVAALRASTHLRPSTALFGLALDTATGALREVCVCCCCCCRCRCMGESRGAWGARRWTPPQAP